MAQNKSKKVINPFEEAYPFVMDEEKQKKLSDASVGWDIITNDVEKANEDSLCTVLSAHDLIDIYVKYEVYKKGDELDIKALQNAIEDWIYE